MVSRWMDLCCPLVQASVGWEVGGHLTGKVQGGLTLGVGLVEQHRHLLHLLLHPLPQEAGEDLHHCEGGRGGVVEDRVAWGGTWKVRMVLRWAGPALSPPW